MELFKDVFLWAYERSAQRYAALRQSMGEPDRFRIKYREDIRGLIREVVAQAMSVEKANVFIETYAERITIADRARFIEVVETELLSLHEGNFARYQVTPLEFDKWQNIWNHKQRGE